MGITLTSKSIASTYDGLLKLSDNDPLSGAFKVVTDGFGNESGVQLNNSGDVNIAGILNVGTRVNTPILQLTGGTGDQGTFSWNTDEWTVDLIQNGTTLQLGQEVQIHVKNQSGATIPDGAPVYATGTLGSSGRITVAPMIADGSIDAKYFLGIATETIADGADGKITTFGKIRGIDTSAYAEGQTLWVSATSAGNYQTTRPVAPNLDLEVAIVINSHANNGTIFVRANNGHYLGTAHDVNISSVAENDLLVYKTNRWVNTKSIGDLSAANVTLSGYLRGPATFVIDPAAYGDETGIVQILGDLRVDGTTTTINSTTISVSDKNITLAKDAVTAGDANGAGITIAGASATLTYLSATDDFTFNKNVNASRFVGPLTGDVTGTVSTLSNHDTDDLNEGLTNLYFTTTRARDSFSAGTGVAINAGEISIGQAVGTTDNVTFNVVTASLSGNASTASALATARNIALDGSVTGNADFDGSGNITITTTTNHNHDDRYYTETESDAKYLLNTTDTLDGDLTVTGQLSVTGTIDLSNADLNIGAADIIFDTISTGANRGLVWNVAGSGFLSKLVGGGTDGGKVTLFANMDDAITTGNIFEIKDGSTGSLFLGLSHAGILTAGGGTSTQWNTAYTYSQVGHLPLAGGTLTGQLTINANSAFSNADANNRLIIQRDSHAYIVYSSPNEYDQGLHFHNTTDNTTVGRFAYKHRAAGDVMTWIVGGTEWMYLNSSGDLTATSFIKSGGTSSQFLKANGTVDSNTYLTTSGKAADSNLLDGIDSTGFVRAYTTTNDNIDSDWGQSFKTFDPIPSGTPPIASPNIRTINVGEDYTRRTQIAFDYITDRAWFRRRTTTWAGWVEFIHSGNIGSQSVNYATSAGSAANAALLDSIDSTQFLRSDENDTMNGNLTVNGTITMSNGSYTAGFYFPEASTPSIFAGNVLRIYQRTEVWGGMGGYYLDVRNASGNPQAKITADGGDSYFVNNLAVGATSASQKLEVNGNIKINNTSGDDLLYFGTDANNYIAYNGTISYWRAGNHYFENTTGYKGRWDSAGNLGIGTTSPVSKLHVVGDGDTVTLQKSNNVPALAFLGTSTNKSVIEGGDNFNFYTGGTSRAYLTNNGTFLVKATTSAYGEPLGYTFGVRGVSSQAYISIARGNQTLDSQGMIVGLDTNSAYVYVRDNIDLSFGTNDTTKMVVKAGGNVGIGTTNPEASLDVVSNSGGNAIAIRTRPANDWGWLIYDSNDSSERLAEIGVNRVGVSSGDLYFTTSGSTKMVIKSGGSVGIGTTSPSAKLEVNGGITATSFNTGNGQFYQSGFWGTTIQSGSGSYSDFAILNSATNGIMFNPTGTLNMVFNGNIGIGTNSPSSPFTVATDVRAATLNATDLRPQSQLNLLGGGGDSLFIGQLTNSTVYIQSSYFNSTLATYPIGINPLGGNVGIGTTSPSARLHVQTSGTNDLLYFDSGVNTDFAFKIVSGADDALVLRRQHTTNGDLSIASFTYNGYVGIGTTSPVTKTHVSSNGNINDAYGLLLVENTSASTNATANSALNVKSYNGTSQFMQWESYGLRIGSRILSNGGVGDVYFTSGADSVGMVLKAGGNLGVGHTSPDYKLHVNGPGGFSSDGASRVLYLRQDAVNSGNIVQFQDQNGTNIWEVVGRNNQFYIYNGAAGNAAIYVTPNANNYVGIGKFSASYKLDVEGTIRAAGDVLAYSDARVKENVETIDNALDKVMSMRGVSYNRTDTDDKTKKVGVIAQEIQKVLPEVVSEQEDGMLSVSYGNIVGVLIEAIKEQQKQIDELKALLNVSPK